MRKKSILFLLVVMCIGFFIPKEVFARGKYIYNNIDIDYQFSILNNGIKVDNLQFRLYDKTGLLHFNSTYNSDTGVYSFYHKDIQHNTGYTINGYTQSSYERDFRSYVKYKNELSMLTTWNDLSTFINNNHLHGKCLPGYANTDHYCNYYSYIPLILEEVSGNFNYKKIVFASLNVKSYSYNQYETENDWYDYVHNDGIFYYVTVSLINNNINVVSCNNDIVSDGYCYTNYDEYYNSLDNVQIWTHGDSRNTMFIRNSSLDYTDELWNEYNTNLIASSEISFDNSDNRLFEPKKILFETESNKAIYSKYNSNVNYRFKVKNGNGMYFKLHDLSNTFNFSSKYDKDSDTYSIVDNSTDSDYQDGIKEFSKIIIDEVKNGNFSELASKYKSITSDNCTSTNCNIYTYIPLILEGDNKDNYAKQIVLGLVDIQYRQENGNDYYDIGLSVYNNTCDLLNSNIDADMSQLINLSRAIEKDYSTSLMNQYSDGSIALDDIYDEVDVNTLKDEYFNKLPVISLRQNPKTLNNGVLVLIISMIVVIGSSLFAIWKRDVKV